MGLRPAHAASVALALLGAAVTVAALALGGRSAPPARPEASPLEPLPANAPLTEARALRTLRAAASDGRIRLVVGTYRTWRGNRVPLYVIEPARAPGERLPVIVAVHARSGGGADACEPWLAVRRLPPVVIACPDGQGRVEGRFSWGAPGQVADLVRLPGVVAADLRGVVDPAAAFITGFSMGGQETLLAVARAPGRFRAAVAIDPSIDLRERYREFVRTHDVWALDHMRREIGDPRTAAAAYAVRSPLDAAAALARSSTRLAIWWSCRDQEIRHAASAQDGPLLDRLAAARPRRPIADGIGTWPHGEPYFGHLDAVLAFFELTPPLARPFPADVVRVAGPTDRRLLRGALAPAPDGGVLPGACAASTRS
jgi:pimeloyl-ACP methyl ester carboxylesterase